MYDGFHKKKLSSTTVFNIDNTQKSFFSTNQQIRIISEWSCDTENRSDDAEKFSFDHRNKLHFNILFILIENIFIL